MFKIREENLKEFDRMNQILFREKLTVDSNLSNTTVRNQRKNKRIFQIFFLLSLFLLFSSLSYVALSFIQNYENEKIAQRIMTQVELSNIYSQPSTLLVEPSQDGSSVIGTLSIPKIDLHYPIFSKTTDELLKIGLCRFSGPVPPEVGNLCIAGHNYNNDKFFSRIQELTIGDKIVLKDILGNSFQYEVYDSLEVKENDSSPISPTLDSKRELTLITCNNQNNNRIILKAQEKETE